MKRLSPQAARERSRSLLYLGAATALGTVFLFVVTVVLPPDFMGDDGRNAAVRDISGWIGLGMAVFGLSWLVRIYRRDPEAGPSPWRYHKWD
jgi:protein-S-isoprenylcysteine O-methyltransferase Ste14